MKRFKKAAFAVIGAVSLLAPVAMGGIVHAQEVDLHPLTCFGVDVEVPFQTAEGCDLSVDKQVSINGGAFVEADTSAEAAQAQVGDTVTWKITVTDKSQRGMPQGWVYVKDILPSSGVAYVSSSATAGTYNTSGFFENYWSLPLLQSDGGNGFATTLPATLTISTTSTSSGLFQNTAALSLYEPPTSICDCEGGLPYSDANSANDSNDAWIDPSAKPQVLADSTTSGSTLANTGNQISVSASLLALGTIIATGLLVLPGRSKKD